MKRALYCLTSHVRANIRFNVRSNVKKSPARSHGSRLRRVHKDKRVNKTNSFCKDFGANTIENIYGTFKLVFNLHEKFIVLENVFNLLKAVSAKTFSSLRPLLHPDQTYRCSHNHLGSP